MRTLLACIARGIIYARKVLAERLWSSAESGKETLWTCTFCYNNNNYFIWEYKQKCNWQLLIQYPSLQFCQLCRLGHCMRSCQLHFCLYSQIKIHQALSNFNFFTAPQSVIRWPVPLGNSQSWLTTQSTITVRQHLSLLGNIFYKESSRFY